MASIEARLAKLEAATASNEDPVYAEFLRRLPPLDNEGHLAWAKAYPNFDNTIGTWLTRLGHEASGFCELEDLTERGLARMLETFSDSSDPFGYEGLRGRVPDRVLPALYNARRNYGYGPEVKARIRQLAGIVDSTGNLKPEYVLHDNGCITDVEVMGHG